MHPTVADVLALEPVRRGSPRVVAAADRLDTPVRWVHVIELTDVRELLRGGEFILSTGIALPADAAGLDRFVAGLISAGASALAVELGSRYVRDLPRALVQSAVAHRLPLIVLERQTQFIAVTEAVHATILAGQVAELQAAQRLHQVFTGLAAAGAGPDEVVARASSFAGVPVILEDLAHRVLACAPAGQETGGLLAGFAARSRTVVPAGRSGYDRAAGWLTTMVGDKQGDWGRLVFALPGEPGPSDYVLAEQAAASLALARLVADARKPPLRRAHETLLAALAGQHYTDPADLQARITALGIPLAGHRLLPVVVRLGPAARHGNRSRSSGQILAVIETVCDGLGIPVLAAVLDGPPGDFPAGGHASRLTAASDAAAACAHVGALLALPAEADEDLLLGQIADRLGAGPPDQPGPNTDTRPVIGAGPTVLDLTDAGRAFLIAAHAANAASLASPHRAAHAGRPFARLADLGLAGLLSQISDDPRVLGFAEREVGPLLAHDQRTGGDLTGLLWSFLRAGGNKARAAQRAGLARPTLYERLRQIEQLLGVRLDSADVRTTLHAALLAHQAAVRQCPVPLAHATGPALG